MGNTLSSLLQQWHQARDDTAWVLGTVYKTQGSAYRKAGAMMLANGRGETFGLLSGGCLEADILGHAQTAMEAGRALTLRYDGRDEDDVSFQLGIGCGGVVHILLQPITPENDLDLPAMATALATRKGGTYAQRIPTEAGEVAARFTPDQESSQTAPLSHHGHLVSRDGQEWLITPLGPEPHLLVVGGGLDARPVVAMAKELGWFVTLCDPRPANARVEFFPAADRILRAIDASLTDYARQIPVDAAILMTHSVDLDAGALWALHSLPLRYIGLLGPLSRQGDVLQAAGVPLGAIQAPLSGPAGLDIGGELPESIALSILAECHAVLYGRTGRDLG